MQNTCDYPWKTHVITCGFVTILMHVFVIENRREKKWKTNDSLKAQIRERKKRMKAVQTIAADRER